MFNNELISERITLSVKDDGSYEVTSSNTARFGVGSLIPQAQLASLLKEGVNVQMGGVQQSRRFDENLNDAPQNGVLLYG